MPAASRQLQPPAASQRRAQRRDPASKTEAVDNSACADGIELVASSVVVAEVSGAETVEWKNLHKVWQLVHEKEAYFDYIRTEVQPFLERL